MSLLVSLIQIIQNVRMSMKRNKDISGLAMSKLYKLHINTINLISSIWCKLKMRLWGIHYGPGCKFGGDMIFFRAPGTTIQIGKGCRFNSNSRFNFRGINHVCILQTKDGGGIFIGDKCGFSGVSIISGCSVSIGNNVLCGANVTIGDRNNHEKTFAEFKPSPVLIGNNVWIGMNSVIMKGVTIGDNTIVGANSVVTKSLPANVIAVGSPCKVIKERNNSESISTDI